MQIKIRPRWALSESQATPETVYRQRRDILKKLGIAAVGLPLSTNAQAGLFDFISSPEEQAVAHRRQLIGATSPLSNSALSLTPEDKVLHYNNFYEFGADKSSPAVRAEKFITDP